MNWTMITIILITFLIIPVISLGFYYLTLEFVKKKPLNLSLHQICLTIGIVGSSLFLLDLLIHPFLNRKTYAKYQKTLPLGTTFLAPSSPHINLETPLAPLRNEKKTFASLPDISLTKKPNIFLFVIETFRKDFLHYAPNLTQFGLENLQFKHSYANANSTHLSWFAIFHSNFPLYWAQTRDNWQEGSIPLRFLKKLGYSIQVYSSTDLCFFNMDKVIFGNQKQLANKIEEYHLKYKEPCERDRMALNDLEKDLQKEGNVYLIFFDSTHSEYSYPKKDLPIYQPTTEEIDYLTIGPKSLQLEWVKNRYRNSIHYLDSLMNQFFNSLKQKDLFENAIIVITGDHGEEFFEEGALFHATHLNEYQTAVPILLKFPSKKWTAQTLTATHIDLFPSILHYLTKQNDFDSLFDGNSIFQIKNTPFRIAVSQNGSDNPIEFSITKKNSLLHARLKNSQTLEVLELKGHFEPDILSPLLKKD